MIGGIFAKHGVWVGTHKQDSKRNFKGSFENSFIAALMVDQFGSEPVWKAEPVIPQPGTRALVERILIRDGYEGGPWMWKGSVMYYPAWNEFKPKVVVCRRDPEASLRSALTGSNVYNRIRDPEVIRGLIDRHNRELDKLVAAGAFEVDTQAVALRDFSTVQAAIEGCGLEFNRRATEAFVDPAMWHQRA
jgi:hypothetical protein